MKIFALFAASGDIVKPENCGQPTGTNANDCLTTFPQVVGDHQQVEQLLTILFGVFAAVAVLVMFMAALNFAAAGADPERLKKARYTILYGLVGLIVAISAEAIALFVLGKL